MNPQKELLWGLWATQRTLTLDPKPPKTCQPEASPSTTSYNRSTPETLSPQTCAVPSTQVQNGPSQQDGNINPKASEAVDQAFVSDEVDSSKLHAFHTEMTHHQHRRLDRLSVIKPRILGKAVRFGPEDIAHDLRVSENRVP